MSATRRHCAVYTRKSTEDRLDMEFNSLDAQREACLAYIASQRSEGWMAVGTDYDDGGFSGGTMVRPALSRLLADIAAGRVNIVVVYKIDRLTRSLMDFARLVQLFDQQGVTFVSVTQSFNTTTSMGRLTLNVLLSFAQFEREVTGERIRDKIAASKRKGMWMGGLVPLGYEACDRHLHVNPDEAATVRHIFDRYLVVDGVRQLKAELDRDGITSKNRVFQDGRTRPGTPIARGALYTLLANPIYIGQIRHGKETYPGQHKAIVSPELWTAVQGRLASKAANRLGSTLGRDDEPLRGKLVASDGSTYTASFTVKAGRRYRYYLNGRATSSSSAPVLTHRLPAAAVESTLETGLRQHLADYDWLSRLLGGSGPFCDLITAAGDGHDPMTVPTGLDLDPAWLVAVTEQQKDLTAGALLSVIARVTVEPAQLTVEVSSDRLLELLQQLVPRHSDAALPPLPIGAALTTVTVVIPYTIVRRAHGAVVIKPRPDYLDPLPLEAADLERLVESIVWRDRHFAGETILAIAADVGKSPSYVSGAIFSTFDERGRAGP